MYFNKWIKKQNFEDLKNLLSQQKINSFFLSIILSLSVFKAFNRTHFRTMFKNKKFETQTFLKVL